MTRALRFTTAAAAISIVSLLAIGCSDSTHNPLGSQATAQSSNLTAGGPASPGSPASSNELAGRVETLEAAARTMTFVGSTVLIMVAADAEVVLKNSGDETPITLDQIAAGDSVEVRGDLAGSGLLANRVRVRVHNEAEHGPENEVEFKAIINGIDFVAGTFTVDTRTETITTDSLSRFYAHVSRSQASTTLSQGNDDLEGKQQIAFADLKVGDTVEVEGTAVNTTTIYAAVVKVENNDHENEAATPEVEFKGMIGSLDYANRIITFFNRTDTGTVAIDAELLGYSGETITLEDFFVCEIVEVKAVETTPGHLAISRMKKDNTI